MATMDATGFRSLIRFGHFDIFYGLALKPEEIRGQLPHPVTEETELDHPGTELTTEQICDRYGDSCADLSELLSYAIHRPDDQRRFPIMIIWRVGLEFWCAILRGSQSSRQLSIYQVHPDTLWEDNYRVLRRKFA